MNNYDVVVIGSGIAGITAAIYLKRASINVALIDMNAPGGQLLNIKAIENYPGFKEITGPDLAWQLYEQVTKLDIPFYTEEVIDIKDGENKVVTTTKSVFNCFGIILATGRAMRTLGLPNEANYRGKGLSFCATCDGALYKDKTVCILGTEKEDIDYLLGVCKEVIILNPTLECEYKNNKQIRVINQAKIEKLEGQSKLESIVVNGEKINTSALFINLDSVPSISFIKDIPIKKDKGYIVVNDKMETNIKGIYACGDIIKKDLYQLVTAASEGAIAATNLRKEIKRGCNEMK